MSFVHGDTSPGYRLLFASVKAMSQLLEEVAKVDAAATLHAGKQRGGAGSWEYGEELVADWCDGGSQRRKYSERVEKEKLDPILERLKTGLAIDDDAILPIPTYWVVPGDPNAKLNPSTRKVGKTTTIADNVGSVNLLVVDKHLMVPRPHGPRLPVNDAKKAATAALKRWFGNDKAPTLKVPSGHYFWARPGESLEHLAAYFVRSDDSDAKKRTKWRKEVIAWIKDDTKPLTVDQKERIAQLSKAIKKELDSSVLDSNDKLKKWQRVKITDGTADVMEIYIQSILEAVGNTVHFVEDFESYHEFSGEVHCGSNAKRTAPESDSGFKARWWDKEVFDPDYDTSYDPKS
jgi:hypothetical protein